MNPTLREPELLEIVAYKNRTIKVGDVVFFLSPKMKQQVVHRVVRFTPQGIATRGDNNSQEDHYRIKSDDILGRVVATWRGSKRRTITGGRQGLWSSRWIRWQCKFDRRASFLLHPMYHALGYWGYLSHIIPNSFRPRVVVFQINEESRPYLFVGKRLIGRYDGKNHQWQISRPFRLIVNEDSLNTPS
jgi:hypothetical protein